MTSFKEDMDKYVEETRKHIDQIKNIIICLLFNIDNFILPFLFFKMENC